MINNSIISKFRKNLYLKPLAFAFCLHLFLIVFISLIGRYQLYPSQFNSRGIGVGFASDSIMYYDRILYLKSLFLDMNFREWLIYGRLHEQLYSLSFIIFSPLCGDSLLCAEPLNIFYYLSILGLVGYLGLYLFDKTSGLIALSVCSVIPSFLLHLTQLLRDPLFITAFLMLVAILVNLLTREMNVRKSLTLFIGGALSLLTIWKARGNFWELILGIVALALVFIIVQWYLRKSFLKLNLVIVSALLLVAVSLPYLITSRRIKLTNQQPEVRSEEHPVNVFNRIIRIRQKFYARYSDNESNIDRDVQIETTADLFRHIPRAFVVGMFAPFPNMLFQEGKQTGKEGLLLGVGENLLMYLFQIFALATLWRQRGRTEIWFLVSIVLSSALAFGLVIVNIGALYRMRYAFWLIIIILASDSLKIAGFKLMERFRNLKHGRKAEPSPLTADGNYKISSVFYLLSPFKGRFN